jgi:hypothetical protein
VGDRVERSCLQVCSRAWSLVELQIARAGVRLAAWVNAIAAAIAAAEEGVAKEDL